MKSDKKTSQAELLAKWKQRKGSAVSTIPVRPSGSLVRPTSGQRRLWLLQELHPKSSFYQYGHLYEFSGPLQIDLLEKSFVHLIERHEILRSNYVADQDGNVAMTVRPTADFTLERLPINTAEGTDPIQAARKRAQGYARRPFRLDSEPLIRAAIITCAPERHVLVVCLHHIIGDRGSLLLFNDELYRTYSALLTGKPLTLSKLPVQFPDYAHWKNQRLPAATSVKYWTDQLAGDLPHSPFPLTHQRRAGASVAGHALTHVLPPSTTTAIKALARKEGTTANVVLLAAFQALHLRYGAPKDVCVGTPISIRDRTELEGMFGFLNETVVIRNVFEQPQESFRELVVRLKRTMEKALEHKDVPFDLLVKRLQPNRQLGANPLFQNMFVYNAPSPAPALPPGLTVSDRMMDLGVAKFDLTLFASDRGDEFDLTLEYATQLFDEEAATRLLTNQAMLITDAVARPDTVLHQLHIFGKPERELRQQWNRTETKLPEADSVVTLILKAAANAPDSIAVTDAKETLTYGQLLRRANHLSADLLAHGVRAQTKVGLSCGRSVDLIVGILGILRAGGAYVPLDPDYPAARVAYVAQDAGIRLIVAPAMLADRFTGLRHVTIPATDEAKSVTVDLPDLQPDDLAYLIYTSGSTGRPKGVVISHANLLHSTAARFAYFERQPTAFLLLSSFAFDSSVAGIFWTLCRGGNLVIPPERSEQDMAALAGLIRHHQVSHTLLLPSLYQLLLETAAPEDLASLSTVMVAGEACGPAVVQRHYAVLPNTALVNEYGPTEGTVWCTAHHVTPVDAVTGVPIGRPIPNVKNYVLDEHRQPVPIGVAGELYLAGPTLASGYWQQPELTAERFPWVELGADVECDGTPLGIGAGPKQKTTTRVYRTGDLARRRSSGIIDFLGRADRQVKIRGHRVEPEEVSRALERQPQVREAVTVVDTTTATPRIVAYFTSHETIATDQLRRALLKDLPAYLIPAAFVSLTEFPRLPNGKVDVHHLPPAGPGQAEERSFVAPQGDTERALAAIWASVLGINQVGRHDNYFDLGGDSIRSIRILAKARREGYELSPTHLFRHQTLHELAAAVDGVDGAPVGNTLEDDAIVLLNEGGDTEPLFCIHSGGGHVFFYQPLASALPDGRPVYAIQPSVLSGKGALPDSIEEMAAEYLSLIRQVRPRGPYHLLGTCFSNVVVLEIAHQLQRAGETVGQLIFVDSAPTQLERQPEVKRPAAYNAAKILFTGDWKKLRRAVYRRWFYVRQALGATVENEEEKQVRLLTNALYQMYFDYDWRPIEAPVTLIRSTEFASREDKAFHLIQWRKLALQGLSVRTTQGTHLNLFAHPQAEGLAQQVDECLRMPATVR